MKTKIAAALFALFAVNAAQANILTNGNFEQGGTGWSITGNAAITGKSGGGFYQGAGSVAQDGASAIVFNGGSAFPNGQVWQTFATTAGQAYTLSFDYGSTSLIPQSLSWTIIGASALFALDGGVVADFNVSGLLDTYVVDFVANSAATTLLFSDSVWNFTYGTDGLLDNVSVNAKGVITPPAAVPEPGSLALLGLGMLGLGALRRRKSV